MSDTDFEMNEPELEATEIAVPAPTLDENTQPVIDAATLEAEGLTLMGPEDGSENLELIEMAEDRIISIVESLLFAAERPMTLASIKQAFKGTAVQGAQIRRALEALQMDYAGGRRGISLEEIQGGYQLRTKFDNVEFLKGLVKTRAFRLSGAALEVLAVVAYKQPCTKSAVDEVRGVESGHLLRALMEKDLVQFAGRSELPGKPMLYATSRKFLEIFGLRNLRELPSISEIDDLMPEGIGAEVAGPTLSEMALGLAQAEDTNYSQGEDELLKISEDLESITTTSDFFEQEKARQKRDREAARAQDLRERMVVGEELGAHDRAWLEKYEAARALE
jgi:segregation and condensation protein B